MYQTSLHSSGAIVTLPNSRHNQGLRDYGSGRAVTTTQALLPSASGRNPVVYMCCQGRNPCYHCGDLRVLKAVGCQALRHLKHCIAFPVQGPRPHADEMAGGKAQRYPA